MGREAFCAARYQGVRSEGKAQLEADHLLFRGDFRAKVPLRAGLSASQESGVLTLVWGEDTLALELGENAAKWLTAIQNPKSRLEKLGVKRGQKVAVVGLRDAQFLDEVTQVLGQNPSRAQERVALTSYSRFTAARTMRSSQR